MAEFLTIATIHLLAVASPGPDFAIVLRQSINHGRKVAIATSIGIGTGILVHVTYSVIGLGVLIAKTPELLTLLKFVAVAYFLYIAWHGLRAKPPENQNDLQKLDEESTISVKSAFTTGFLINALNIKATLFFVALYSIVIDQETSTTIRALYGVYMAVATGLWFSFLSYLMSLRRVRLLLINKSYWVERVMAIVLIAISVDMLLGEY